VGLVVGAAGRHVDRHVADQAHAELGGVGAQRAPLAIEADLVGRSAVAREPLPVADPEALARAELRELALGHRSVRIGEQVRRGREGGRRLVGRPAFARRPERQHLPPGLARGGQPVDEPVRIIPEAAAGKRGGMELDAGRPRQA
jgi:hypothetical protein